MKIDCFSAEIRSLEGQYFDLQVGKILKEGVEGRLMERNEGYSEGSGWCVTNHGLDKIEFSATHFLGLRSFQYSSPLKFLMWKLVKIPKLIILKDRLSQLWFNSKTPARTNRIETLRELVDMRLETDANSPNAASEGKDSIEILAKIHGRKIIFHPEYKSTRASLELDLESLVESGDLHEKNRYYRATGKALSTIANYEQENRRHQEQMQHNSWIKWLTIALVFVGMLQAFYR